jgi:hypothetical protein
MQVRGLDAAFFQSGIKPGIKSRIHSSRDLVVGSGKFNGRAQDFCVLWKGHLEMIDPEGTGCK